jgi:hypothetical protein
MHATLTYVSPSASIGANYFPAWAWNVTVGYSTRTHPDARLKELAFSLGMREKKERK